MSAPRHWFTRATHLKRDGDDGDVDEEDQQPRPEHGLADLQQANSHHTSLSQQRSGPGSQYPDTGAVNV